MTEMKKLNGHQRCHNRLSIFYLFIFCCSLSISVTSARELSAGGYPHKLVRSSRNSELDDQNHSLDQKLDGAGTTTDGDKSCDSVKLFFGSINVTMIEVPETQTSDGLLQPRGTGTICGGHCCNNETEDVLMKKSTTNFIQMLRHHTKSLRSSLEETAETFRKHILEMSYQSENNTLNLFSQVYRRMSPLSRKPIEELYSKIRSYLSSTEHDHNHHHQHHHQPQLLQLIGEDIDVVVKQFFIELFPLAYHHAVHYMGGSNTDDTITSTDNIHDPNVETTISTVDARDFHIDYKNCLKHSYDDLQPFGQTPKVLAKSLEQSVEMASVFVAALDRGADVLLGSEHINIEYLSNRCQMQLMRMNYCAQCNGHGKLRQNICAGYCLNVVRGCLAQFVGVLDNPWTNVADSIESMWHDVIKTDRGILNVLVTLNDKLSEAIMYAMENGPGLERKVRKSCGNPTLLTSKSLNSGQQPVTKQGQSSSRVSLPNTDMLHFLVTISKSKNFYSKIVDSVCQDEEFRQDNRHCWNGHHVGEYSPSVMSTGTDAQRYNPEVPLEDSGVKSGNDGSNSNSHGSTDNGNKLNELVDKLLKLRNTINNAMSAYSSPTSLYSDIQGDMAHDDFEGSAYTDEDVEDDESINLAGSGSGDGEDDQSGDNSRKIGSVPNEEPPASKTGGACDSYHSFTYLRISLLLPFLLFLTNHAVFG